MSKNRSLSIRIPWVAGLILLPLFSGHANAGNDLPPGEYKLSFPDQRPNPPYNQLPNYNTRLDASGTGPGYTVQVSRHHIIPYNILRRFYNTVISRPGDQLLIRSFFLTMGDEVQHYAARGGTSCQVGNSDLADAATLSLALSDNYARQGQAANNPPLGFDTFWQFYTWLPGNLFIGPTNRTDDPGENFEANAAAIVGQSAFQTFQRLYTNMVNYNAAPSDATLRSIASDLTNIAQRRSAYPLNSLDWVNDKGQYRIRQNRTNQQMAAQQASDSQTGDSPDAWKCYLVLPHYKRDREKYLSVIVNGHRYGSGHDEL